MDKSLDFLRSLVPLGSLSENTWLNTRVYHPMCQAGEPYWRECDEPEALRSEDATDYICYDTGVVVDIADSEEIGFMTEGGYLHYPAYNLWVEK